MSPKSYPLALYENCNYRIRSNKRLDKSFWVGAYFFHYLLLRIDPKMWPNAS